MEEFLQPRIGRLTLPYRRERPIIEVGYGLVLYSPLENDERQVLRLIEDAHESLDLRRRVRERDQKEQLLEIIYNRQIWTAFQPIVEIASRQVVGWEGLSRGPRGSDLELPLVLFGRAGRHGLTEELERSCRRQGFVDWEVFGAPGRLFMNTVPATIRDTSFIGRGVLDYLGPRMSPRLVTLEITERQVIENLNLYRDAMHAFLDMGFSFAIDDVGAGYSGPGDGGGAQAQLPEDRHEPGARRAPEEDEPAGGEGDRGDGRRHRRHRHRRGHPDPGGSRHGVRPRACASARATTSGGRSTRTPRRGRRWRWRPEGWSTGGES